MKRIIERAARATSQEAYDLNGAWWDARDWRATWDAAWAVDRAARAAGRDTAAVESAAWDVARQPAEYAAADAAVIAAVADLVGQRGLTREHLETLAGPWRQVIDDVDPLAGLESNDG